MTELQWEEKVWGRVVHQVTLKVITSILEVKAGFRCSIHLHRHRWNRFHVMDGCIRVIRSDGEIADGSYLDLDETLVRSGQVVDIHPDQLHRFEVVESGTVVETYWTTDGTNVDLDDIERLDEGGPIKSTVTDLTVDGIDRKSATASALVKLWYAMGLEDSGIIVLPDSEKKNAQRKYWDEIGNRLLGKDAPSGEQFT